MAGDRFIRLWKKWFFSPSALANSCNTAIKLTLECWKNRNFLHSSATWWNLHFFPLQLLFFRRLKRICISKASLKIQSNVKCNSEYDWGLHNAMSFFFFFLFPDPSVASIWFRSIPEATRTAHLRAFAWQTAESFSSDDFNYNWVSLITYAWAKVDFIFRGCAKNVTRSKILLFFFVTKWGVARRAAKANPHMLP